MSIDRGRCVYLETVVSSGHRGKNLLLHLEQKNVKVWAPAFEPLLMLSTAPKSAEFDIGILDESCFENCPRTIAQAHAVAKEIFPRNATPEEVAVHLAESMSLDHFRRLGFSRLVVLHPPFYKGRTPWQFSVEVNPVVWHKGEKPQNSVCLTAICSASFAGVLASDYGFVHLLPRLVRIQTERESTLLGRLAAMLKPPPVLSPTLG